MEGKTCRQIIVGQRGITVSAENRERLLPECYHYYGINGQT
jgi:hypothetical protein